MQMTKLLDDALKAAGQLPAKQQDEIARIVLQLADIDLHEAVPLTPDEREAIERSKAAAAKADFATEEQVKSVWSRHGL